LLIGRLSLQMRALAKKSSRLVRFLVVGIDNCDEIVADGKA